MDTLLTAIAASLAASAASAAPPPEAVRAMIAKALESGEPDVVAAVSRIAKQANPDSAAEIDALVRGETVSPIVVVTLPPAGAVAAAPLVAVAVSPRAMPAGFDAPSPVEWKGTAELGGSRSTGSSDVLGAYGALDLSRAAGDWTHRLSSRAEYQRTNGQTSTERYGLAYEPRLQIKPSLYSFGLAQYEHDRFLGYSSRYTAGAGLGMKLVERPDLTVGGDLGPALRRTDYYLLPQENAWAGRASLNIKWLPTQRITLSQEAAVYAYGQQTSAKSVTALETLLFGPLKARLSYNLQYEHDPRLLRDDLDTVTRASLRYSF